MTVAAGRSGPATTPRKPKTGLHGETGSVNERKRQSGLKEYDDGMEEKKN
jgi:hypothetical protein